jgi:peptide/nickel transport system substrate-binding protein
MGMLVTESVVDFDEHCNVVPGVADSWKISADASEYTFFLRKGVRFHNGRELLAEDVKKNYEHFMDPKTGAPDLGDFQAAINRIEAVDKYTVKFHLKGPNAGFFNLLRPTNAFITAEESFEAKPPRPIGTGPFEFVEWQPRQYLKLRRFKNYWKKDKNGNALPYVDEVILKPITDDTVRYTALRTGDVDWVWELPFEQVPEVMKANQSAIVAAVRPGVRWFYLMFQTQRGPLKDARVRQAIASALNKKNIMDGLTWGVATPEAQPFAPGSQWYFPVKDPYGEGDLEKARKLLKEAGYEKGLQLDTIVRNESVIMNLTTLAQAQLKKAGIDLKLQLMDRATHQARQGKGDWDVNPGHLSYCPDPDCIYYRFWLSTQRSNYARYNNPEYDKLMEEGRRTSDVAKRKEIYRKGLDLLTRDLPIVFLGHLPVAQASRSHVKNLKTNCRGDVRWSEGGVSHAWIEK